MCFNCGSSDLDYACNGNLGTQDLVSRSEIYKFWMNLHNLAQKKIKKRGGRKKQTESIWRGDYYEGKNEDMLGGEIYKTKKRGEQIIFNGIVEPRRKSTA